jgi:hypothetical protein
MNPSQYLKKVQSLSILDLIEECIYELDKEGKVTELVKEQLGEGKRGDGSYLKKYSPLTIESKRKRGTIIMGERIALIDTGEFWKSFFTELGENFISIDAKDWKRDELVSRYGEEIFLISKPQMSELASLVKPLLKAKTDAHFNA